MWKDETGDTTARPPRSQDVWTTMSAGSLSLHSMAGFSPPGVRQGETMETEDYLEPTPPLQSPPIDPGYKSRREGSRRRAHIQHDLDSGDQDLIDSPEDSDLPLTHRLAPRGYFPGDGVEYTIHLGDATGVADVDGLELVVDGNMNGLSPRMPSEHVTDRMHRPDSLAVRGHEYEELPASRYQVRYPYVDMEDNSSRSGSGGGRPLPIPMLNELKAPAHTDSNDSLCRPLSGTSSNGGVHSERYPNTYRKRENPLYDEGDTDDLQLKPGSGRPGGFLACPCLGLILVGLVACISFLLAVLLILGTFRAGKEVTLAPATAALVEQLNQSELLTALTNVKRLESQYNILMKKYTVMEGVLNVTQLSNGSVSSKVDRNAKAIEFLLSNSGLNLPSAHTLFEKMEHYNRVEQKQNESIAEIYSKVESLQYKLEQLNSSVRQELSSLRKGVSVTKGRITRIENDFSQKLSSLGTNLTNQVYQVGKLQGPKGDRGPPGVSGSGNMTRCEYSFKKLGSSIGQPDTSTDWWPAETSEIQSWVITGLECTTKMGKTSLLEIQPHPTIPNVDQFRCVCRGSIEGATSRFCILNIWRCPRAA